MPNPNENGRFFVIRGAIQLSRGRQNERAGKLQNQRGPENKMIQKEQVAQAEKEAARNLLVLLTGYHETGSSGNFGQLISALTISRSDVFRKKKGLELFFFRDLVINLIRAEELKSNKNLTTEQRQFLGERVHETIVQLAFTEYYFEQAQELLGISLPGTIATGDPKLFEVLSGLPEKTIDDLDQVWDHEGFRDTIIEKELIRLRNTISAWRGAWHAPRGAQDYFEARNQGSAPDQKNLIWIASQLGFYARLMPHVFGENSLGATVSANLRFTVLFFGLNIGSSVQELSNPAERQLAEDTLFQRPLDLTLATNFQSITQSLVRFLENAIDLGSDQHDTELFITRAAAALLSLTDFQHFCTRFKIAYNWQPYEARAYQLAQRIHARALTVQVCQAMENVKGIPDLSLIGHTIRTYGL